MPGVKFDRTLVLPIDIERDTVPAASIHHAHNMVELARGERVGAVDSDRRVTREDMIKMETVIVSVVDARVPTLS